MGEVVDCAGVRTGRMKGIERKGDGKAKGKEYGLSREREKNRLKGGKDREVDTGIRKIDLESTRK